MRYTGKNWSDGSPTAQYDCEELIFSYNDRIERDSAVAGSPERNVEQLTKTQALLLNLLVTFVTSIATGIVTVALLEQAPPAVTQTINRVVEKTVERIVPTNTGQATVVTEKVIVKTEDLTVKAVEENAQSILVLRGTGIDGTELHAGLGFIVSSDGIAVADRQSLAGADPASIRALYRGTTFPATLISSEATYGFVLLKLHPPKEEPQTTAATTTGNEGNKKSVPAFIPVRFTDSNAVKLGQSAIFLSGRRGTSVVTGIVSDLVTETVHNGATKKDEERLRAIRVSVPLSAESGGAPLITAEGTVAGVMLFDAVTGLVQSAVPSNDIKDVVIAATAATTTPSSSAPPQGQ